MIVINLKESLTNVCSSVEVVDVEAATTFLATQRVRVDQQTHDLVSGSFTLAPLANCRNINQFDGFFNITEVFFVRIRNPIANAHCVRIIVAITICVTSGLDVSLNQ
jgi:hypothetical protein